MSILCDGFNENRDLPVAVLSGFKKLKNYERNSLFHSKIEDSLKCLCFVECGFVYTYDMDEYKDHFLPAHKIKLTVSDAIEVNKLVDDIVYYILESMNQDTRNTTETYIPSLPLKSVRYCNNSLCYFFLRLNYPLKAALILSTT